MSILSQVLWYAFALALSVGIIPGRIAPRHINNSDSRGDIVLAVSHADVEQPKPVPAPSSQPVTEPVSPAEVETKAETPTPTVAERPATVVAVGTNEAMQFIFAQESSNNPAAIAPNGACGLGQAWPCSKLLDACGSLSNIDCQIQFFTDYAISRYGSWTAAMGYWQNNQWW